MKTMQIRLTEQDYERLRIIALRGAHLMTLQHLQPHYASAEEVAAVALHDGIAHAERHVENVIACYSTH